MSRTRRNPGIVKGDFEKTRTKQSFAKEVNINNIMRRYVKTGAITHFAKHQPQYADVTGIDFQSALLLVTDVQQMFAELPAELRAKFDQKPEAFLDWIQDDANKEEAERLGFRDPTPFEHQNERTLEGEDLSELTEEPKAAEPPAAETRTE